jgi:hypothetical protein
VHVVASALGHSSPAVTHAHYIDSDEPDAEKCPMDQEHGSTSDVHSEIGGSPLQLENTN